MGFKDFSKDNGLRYLHTMPYTLKQNGIAEGRNRSLMEMVMSMMDYADLL